MINKNSRLIWVTASYFMLLIGPFFAVWGIMSLDIKSVGFFEMFLFSSVLIPYLTMGLLIRRDTKHAKKTIPNLIIAILISAIGSYAVVDVMVLHPDPLGPIALFMVSIFQFVIIGVGRVISSKPNA